MGFVISLIAGLIGSMVGIGGGIIITPYLSYFNYFPSQISSTSLMPVFSTSLSSSVNYSKKKLISRKIGILLAGCSIPGTFIGVYLSSLFSLSQFKIYFAFILIGTSIYLLLKSKYPIKKVKNPDFNDMGFRNGGGMNHLKISLLVISSVFAGILSSSFGIGGGIIFVPSLIVFFGFNMNRAAATSQFALLFTSLTGLILYIYNGSPDYSVGFILSCGSIVGGILGSRISVKTNSNLLQKIFSFVLILVSTKLFYDGFIQ